MFCAEGERHGGPGGWRGVSGALRYEGGGKVELGNGGKEWKRGTGGGETGERKPGKGIWWVSRIQEAGGLLGVWREEGNRLIRVTEGAWILNG